MSVNLRVGPIAYPVGTAAFLGAFFDTVALRLEGGRRGDAFPALARLYETAALDPASAPVLRAELTVIRDGLRVHPPTAVVWDIDDPQARPPWGDDIAPTIADLSGYFVTSDGRDLIDVLDLALDASARTGRELRIG